LRPITGGDEQYDAEAKVRHIRVRLIKTVRIPTLGANGSFLAIMPANDDVLPTFNLSAEEYFRGITEGIPGRLVDKVYVAFGGFVKAGLVNEGTANLLLVWTTRKHASGTNERFRGSVHVQRVCDEFKLQINEMLRTEFELWQSLTKNVASEVKEQHFRELTHRPLGN